MQKTANRLVAALLGAVMLGSVSPALAAQAAQAPSGTPYGADGTYDVSVEHVVINQVFGASDDAEVVSHSFIELYNPTSADVSLNGWYLYYQPSADGKNSVWQSLALSGSIEAGGYYLVRCGQVDDIAADAYMVPDGDAEWEIRLHNKGVSVALFSQQMTLSELFAGAITQTNRPEGYVDLLAVQGNDGEQEQIPPVYEGTYAAVQSKKKAIARIAHADTDDNGKDAGELDYSKVTPADVPVQNSKGETIAEQSAQEPAYSVRNDGFVADAALVLDKKGSVTLGTANPDGGVAEIVAYNAENGKAYVVNGAESLLNVFDVKSDGTFGDVTSVDVEARMQTQDASFAYGDMTSVAVDAAHDRIAVALQDEDYTKAGRVAVLNYENEIVAVYETGVQPDMLTFAADGRYILTADEGEPRGGYGAGAVDPAGSVTVIDTQATGTAEKVVGFGAFDAAVLARAGVVFNDPDGDGTPLSAAADLEPEYIAVNGNTAYVSLQEANAIAVLDIEKGVFTAVLPLGFKDYSLPGNAVDLDDSDGTCLPKTYEDTYGVYMPDGIAVYEKDGSVYLLTANEGDAREWGDEKLGQEEFTDEAKRDLVSADGTVTAEKVRVLDNSVKAGIGDGNYLYGTRSFSVFQVTGNGMTLVYDSANEFEAKTWEYLPAFYNVSNDDLELESRTAKKGVEPEAVTLAGLGGRMYAFIALERIGGIMVYDVSDPTDAQYVNYVNTRDFNASTAGDVAPEGLAVVHNGDTALLLAAFEVSGTVASYQLTATASEPENPDTEPEEPGTEPENPGTEPETPGTEPENPGTMEPENPGTQPADPTGGDGQSDPDNGLTPGAIAGICIAAVVVVGGAVTAVVLVRRKKKQ